MNSQHAEPTALTPAEPLPAPQTNGSSGKISTWSGSHRPASSNRDKTGRRFLSPKILIPVAAVLGLAGVGAGYYAYTVIFRPTHTDLLTHKVKYEKLELTIVERGQLESADNRDVVCRVKAKSPQNPTATSIKWVIDDGSIVK